MFNFNDQLTLCPVCGVMMERGFASRSSSLSFITLEKVQHFAFLDEDLNRAGLKKFLPAKAEYELSYRCEQCRIYIVEYGKALSSAEAKKLAASL